MGGPDCQPWLPTHPVPGLELGVLLTCILLQVDYPGEMRAFELQAFRNLASRFATQPSDAVLFMGDFNINVRKTGLPGADERFVFRGVIPHGSLPDQYAPLQLSTGYEDSSAASGEARFVWERGGAAASKPLVLRDAHHGVNCLAQDPKTGAVLGSSHNAGRVCSHPLAHCIKPPNPSAR